MLEIICTVLFGWIFIKVLALMFKVAWSLTKIIAVLLFVLACPALLFCFLFAGGIVFLLPIALIAGAFGLLKRYA